SEDLTNAAPGNAAREIDAALCEGVMSSDRLSTPRTAAANPRVRRTRSMPRAARRPARRRVPASADQDGRERILSVAIRSFSELGYEGTTTAGVARDAGVT